MPRYCTTCGCGVGHAQNRLLEFFSRIPFRKSKRCSRQGTTLVLHPLKKKRFSCSSVSFLDKLFHIVRISGLSISHSIFAVLKLWGEETPSSYMEKHAKEGNGAGTENHCHNTLPCGRPLRWARTPSYPSTINSLLSVTVFNCSLSHPVHYWLQRLVQGFPGAMITSCFIVLLLAHDLIPA